MQCYAGRSQRKERKLEWRKAFGSPKLRWENNITMDLRERMGGYGWDSSSLGQEPVVGCCEHSNELSCSIRGGEFLH
jgi:hypothetical protein